MKFKTNLMFCAHISLMCSLASAAPSTITNNQVDNIANKVMALPLGQGTDLKYPYPVGIRYYRDRAEIAQELQHGSYGKSPDYVCFVGVPADEIISRKQQNMDERYPAQCVSQNSDHNVLVSSRQEFVIDGFGTQYDFRSRLGASGNFTKLGMSGCVGTDLDHMFCSFKYMLTSRRPDNSLECDTLAGVVDCGHPIRPGEGTGG